MLVSRVKPCDPLPDVTVPAIPAGYYAWQFEGLDTQNTLFIHSTFDTYGPPATIGNTVWCDEDEDGFWDGIRSAAPKSRAFQASWSTCMTTRIWMEK